MSEAERSSQARAYFGEIFEHKPKELTVVVWVKAPDTKVTSYSLNPDAATRDAMQATGDVYAGVGYAPEGFGRQAGAHKRRPGKQQVAGIVGVWCDIDVNGGPEGKSGAAPSRDAAAELIARAPLQPTMVVDSGYGLQPYWLLEQPWIFRNADERADASDLVAKWYGVLRGLAADIDPGFGIDGTADLSRVLRVPGTFNLKGDLKAPVRLLDHHAGRRYTLDDFAPHVAEVQLSLAHSAAIVAGANADDITVNVLADAEPPFEKFEALTEVDDLFASAWNRKRQGEREAGWSASEWDMALCDRAVRARWENQELTDLLVASRRKHGDGLKRPDYYARTIARARATITLDDASARRDEAIAELIAPPVSATDIDPEHVLSLFEQVVGVPLKRFVQYGRDPDEGGVFELVLAGSFDGQAVRIPTARELLDFAEVRRRVVTVTAILPPPVKRDDWDKVVARMFGVRELHEDALESAVGVLQGWLRSYLANTEGADRVEALRHGYPHVHEGSLYVQREHFQSYVRTRFGERVSRRDLQSWLKAAGFRTHTVGYRKASGASTTTSLYARAVGEDDGT